MCKLKYSFSHRLPVGHRGLRAIIPAMMLGLIVGRCQETIISLLPRPTAFCQATSILSSLWA